MTIRVLNYYILYGVFFILFNSCKKENNPCEIIKEGANYVVSNAAKMKASNYFNADKIIFKTLSGEEIAFKVMAKDTIGSYEVGFPCEEDTSQNKTVKGTSQVLSFSLINKDVISERIIINLFKYPETPTQQAQESLLISLGEYYLSTFGNGDELFYYNVDSINPHLNYRDSVVLGGKTFYSVYAMNNNTTQNIEIKYTEDLGIIYMKNPVNSTEYIYERKK